MTSLTTRLTGIFEIALSVLGAALLTIQTITGADGIAQIAAALVTLVAPVCAAVRSTRGADPQDIAAAIAGAITGALGEQSDAA